MINFIICDDNEKVLKINVGIVKKLMFKNDINYKIYSFVSYNNDLKNIINKDMGQKIYIIDIDLGNISGIDLVRKIRKDDWDSKVIFATAHNELFPQVVKDRLMIFDFISKFDDYENSLTSSILEILKIYNFDRFININIRKVMHSIRCKDILYLTYEKFDRKTTIITLNEKYKVSKSLKSLSLSLPKNFIKINNHCIINTCNVSKMTSSGELRFINGSKLSEKITDKELLKNGIC